MKQYKKYIIFIGILIVLSPLGLILPDYFKAGDAWGEWSVESVKEQTGHEPEGMKKDAAIYAAPVPDYNLGKEDDSLSKLSVSYIISGLIGTGIILLLTFGTSKIMSRKSVG
jgi:cobalt/nickel transport protein